MIPLLLFEPLLLLPCEQAQDSLLDDRTMQKAQISHHSWNILDQPTPGWPGSCQQMFEPTQSATVSPATQLGQSKLLTHELSVYVLSK